MHDTCQGLCNLLDELLKLKQTHETRRVYVTC